MRVGPDARLVADAGNYYKQVLIEVRENTVKTLIGLVATLCASTAMASNGGPLFPSYVSTMNNGFVYVYFTGTRSGTIPSCAANIGGTYYRYVLDTNTAGGKSQLANILAAAYTGMTMWFQGTGDCNIDGTNESLAQIHPNQ